ncbi:hypothetical protein [Streptacidiphilus rugosus]|uniref:hypothetical protein n=1 Tax=Streptacidiphilus rugosus TaxID=405783 RepID=UPI00055AD7C0|nr:hypothetical protein [Streptacidiphilus rugosus]
MIDEREELLTRALGALAGDPAPPCRVDIGSVVAAGRRDRGRRRVWKVGSAAALAGVVIGAGLVIHHGDDVESTPAHRPHKSLRAPAPVPALALTLTPDDPHQVLKPGGQAGIVLMKITNTTGAAEQFTGLVSFWPKGSLTLSRHDTDVTFTSVGGAPKLPATTDGWTHPVSIPAHASYTWKAAVRATTAWPRNDSGLGFEVGVLGQNPFVINKQMTWYAVGSAKTGPIVTALAGDTRLAPGHPAVEKLTVTNHSGARIDQPLTIQASLAPPGPTRLAIDEWIGTTAHGHWQALTNPTLQVPAGLDNDATSTFTLRVRVVSYSGPTSQVNADLIAMDQDTTGPGTTADQPLTVLRTL